MPSGNLPGADARPAVRCYACELRQFAGTHCRRCKADLPLPLKLPEPEIIVLERPLDVRKLGELLTGLATLPTLAELERLVIAEALRRANGNAEYAAKLIGVGKMTIYRKRGAKAG